MSRPEKEKKKTFRKEILFSEEEYKVITDKFEKSDYTNINSMLRDILINNEYRIVTFDNDARIKKGILIEEVRRIGNNFNQLIRSFNQRKMDSFSKDEINLLIKNVDDIKIIYSKIESNI
ncbi:hypothetical protein [Flavobacterium sp. GSB-24]|uniref:plasmid mobilization protein n=1 Tax=Flavobacterium sp. GSB-24 TaxID=2994319 RepID=UPI002490E949|nr:hypothetical protein [Flavobacterium sp. GSB-24]BDU27681.1 hypothetical protein FLGSB24_44250 [Flavobacterium sp. GSB-24]